MLPSVLSNCKAQHDTRTSAMVDISGTVYRLSTEALNQMQQEAPQAAIAFQKAINYLLAERLSRSYQEIERLLH